MIRGTIAMVWTACGLSGPVRLLRRGSNGAAVEVRQDGAARTVKRRDLRPARLWVARGAEWFGPFRGWRQASRAILDAAGGEDGPEIISALEHGRALETGAVVIADGWRWRLVWSGDEAPRRFGN